MALAGSDGAMALPPHVPDRPRQSRTARIGPENQLPVNALFTHLDPLYRLLAASRTHGTAHTGPRRQRPGHPNPPFRLLHAQPRPRRRPGPGASHRAPPAPGSMTAPPAGTGRGLGTRRHTSRSRRRGQGRRRAISRRKGAGARPVTGCPWALRPLPRSIGRPRLRPRLPGRGRLRSPWGAPVARRPGQCGGGGGGGGGSSPRLPPCSRYGTSTLLRRGGSLPPPCRRPKRNRGNPEN